MLRPAVEILSRTLSVRLDRREVFLYPGKKPASRGQPVRYQPGWRALPVAGIGAGAGSRMGCVYGANDIGDLYATGFHRFLRRQTQCGCIVRRQGRNRGQLRPAAVHQSYGGRPRAGLKAGDGLSALSERCAGRREDLLRTGMQIDRTRHIVEPLAQPVIQPRLFGFERLVHLSLAAGAD